MLLQGFGGASVPLVAGSVVACDAPLAGVSGEGSAASIFFSIATMAALKQQVTDLKAALPPGGTVNADAVFADVVAIASATTATSSSVNVVWVTRAAPALVDRA